MITPLNHLDSPVFLNRKNFYSFHTHRQWPKENDTITMIQKWDWKNWIHETPANRTTPFENLIWVYTATLFFSISVILLYRNLKRKKNSLLSRQYLLWQPVTEVDYGNLQKPAIVTMAFDYLVYIAVISRVSWNLREQIPSRLLFIEVNCCRFRKMMWYTEKTSSEIIMKVI